MRAPRSTSVFAFVGVVAFAQLILAGSCVDGKTPDCSDAAAGCGPDVPADAQEGSTLPEAAPVDAADAASDQAASDAGDASDDADADMLDAGDEI